MWSWLSQTCNSLMWNIPFLPSMIDSPGSVGVMKSIKSSRLRMVVLLLFKEHRRIAAGAHLVVSEVEPEQRIQGVEDFVPLDRAGIARIGRVEGADLFDLHRPINDQ